MRSQPSSSLLNDAPEPAFGRLRVISGAFESGNDDPRITRTARTASPCSTTSLYLPRCSAQIWPGETKSGSPLTPMSTSAWSRRPVSPSDSHILEQQVRSRPRPDVQRLCETSTLFWANRFLELESRTSIAGLTRQKNCLLIQLASRSTEHLNLSCFGKKNDDMRKPVVQVKGIGFVERGYLSLFSWAVRIFGRQLSSPRDSVTKVKKLSRVRHRSAFRQAEPCVHFVQSRPDAWQYYPLNASLIVRAPSWRPTSPPCPPKDFASDPFRRL